MSKNAKLLLFLGLLGLAFALPVPAFANGDVFEAASNLAKDASRAVVTVSTPAALIGVGTGAFMKKFSMGDHQKIASGNKIFWGSIIGWGTINGLTLVLNTVQKYIT